uniref:Putative secreted protein n=1 Tax=Anopheles darlingi TaxID=43151 RepID=A0A2M4DJP7_ANODA
MLQLVAVSLSLSLVFFLFLGTGSGQKRPRDMHYGLSLSQIRKIDFLALKSRTTRSIHRGLGADFDDKPTNESYF